MAQLIVQILTLRSSRSCGDAQNVTGELWEKRFAKFCVMRSGTRQRAAAVLERGYPHYSVKWALSKARKFRKYETFDSRYRISRSDVSFTFCRDALGLRVTRAHLKMAAT